MTFWESWGKLLLKTREGKGLSRRALEDQSGVSQRHIAYLESGEKQPGADTLKALARVLGPEILDAAFRDVAILSARGTGSKDRATGRKLGRPEWPIPEQTFDLIPA